MGMSSGNARPIRLDFREQECRSTVSARSRPCALKGCDEASVAKIVTITEAGRATTVKSSSRDVTGRGPAAEGDD